MITPEAHTTATQHRPETRSAGETFFQRNGERGFFGNERVAHPFFSPRGVQPKLKIGAPHDAYEREADQVADQVVQRLAGPEASGRNSAPTGPVAPSGARAGAASLSRAPAPESEEEGPALETEGTEPIRRKAIFDSGGEEEGVQRKCAACAKEKEELVQRIPVTAAERPSLRRKCAACAAQEEIRPKRLPGLQRHSDGSLTADAGFSSRLRSTRGGGQALPTATRTTMEGAMGADLSGVRVHTGSEAAGLSDSIGAQAFTHGSEVYFNRGKYDPGSTAGQRLLAHELTHTVQQSPAIQRTEGADAAPDDEGSCPNYEHGEVGRSRIEPAILGADVSRPRAGELLVADFGVGRTRVRASSQAEPLFQEQRTQFEDNCALHFKIHGFTDCSGTEDRNQQVREQRADALLRLLGPQATARVSETTFAPMGTTVADNSTPENRAHNRSVTVFFREGFWLQTEALAIAAAAQAEIQTALSELRTSAVPREKNIPEYLTQKTITLEPLTPTHNALLSASPMEFFAGTVDYTTLFTLPQLTRFKIHAANTRIAIQTRELPCIQRSLPQDQIKERIVEAVSLIVHQEAHGNSPFEQYRALFNSRYPIPPFNSLSDAFDLALDSFGPRTERSRALFLAAYQELPSFRLQYDGNIGGIKEKVDTYYGPDSLNLINSPRLEVLIGVFNAAATPVAAADFAGFQASVTIAANTLDTSDTDAIETSQEWQLLLIGKIPDQAQRSAIVRIIEAGPANRPAPPGPGPTPGPPPTPAPPVTGAGQAFLDHLSIQGPTAPIAAQDSRQSVPLIPASDRPNPDVPFKTSFSLTPASKVAGSADSPRQTWPIGDANGVAHEARIVVDGTASMSAALNVHDLPPGGGPTTPVAPHLFTVTDDRMNHVLATWRPVLLFNGGQAMEFFRSGATVTYLHGGQNFKIRASLPGDTNPNLDLEVNARVKRAASLLDSNPSPVAFPNNNSQSPDIALNILAPDTVPSGGDPIKVELDLLESGAVRATKTILLTIQTEPRFTKAQAIAAAVSDKQYFTSTLLPLMRSHGGIEERVADAVLETEANGGITLEPLGIRHDSVEIVEQLEGSRNPEHVAYFAGTSYRNRNFFKSYPHLIKSGPNAAGFSSSCCPDLGNRLIVLNRTFDVISGGTRSDATLIRLLTHEAVHAMDKRPDSNTPIERYKTEFRAYWMDGRYGDPNTLVCPGSPTSCSGSLGSGVCHDARFEPGCSNLGPKSPRARAIFMHLYGNDLYDFVKENYDANTNGFREQVDRYLFPDGINLMVSTRLERLRKLIEDWNGSNFAGLNGRVRTFMQPVGVAPAGGRLDADEKAYIRQSRAWRDLVERKVPAAADRETLKRTLGIPLEPVV